MFGQHHSKPMWSNQKLTTQSIYTLRYLPQHSCYLICYINGKFSKRMGHGLVFWWRSSASRRKRGYSLVKKEKFTTEGIKEHDDAVIARLYEVGLSVCLFCGCRRFATQIELSNHFDALFRKNKLEKTMAISLHSWPNEAWFGVAASTIWRGKFARSL